MPSVAFHDVEPGGAASLGVISRALDGEVFVLRQVMQRVDIHDRLVAACRAGIESSGCDIGAWSVAAGFDQLHRFVRAADVPVLTTAVQHALVEVYHEILGRLLRDGLGYDRPLYAMDHPIARFLLPYDASAAQRTAYQCYGEERGHGKITVLRPHRDNWFADSTRTINIWIAVGPVEMGNGLSIYPEPYRQPLDFVPKAGVMRSQAVGTPVNFELAPGDVVVFHANHLHASELNRTDRTRHVVSFRVQPSRFLALGPTERMRSFHPSRPLFARAVDPVARKIGGVLSLMRTAQERPGKVGPSPQPSPAERGRGSKDGGTSLFESPPRWRPDAAPVRALSDDLCSVELADGRRRVFARRCPHQGADLALGYVRDGRIVCPWHNLPFDLETGLSPCKTVLPLGIAS